MLMLSKPTSDSPTKLKKPNGDEQGETVGLAQKMYQLKKKIQAERVSSVKEKLEQNRKKLEGYVSEISSVISKEMELNGSSSLLNSRIQHPPCKFSGFSKGFGEKEYSNDEEDLLSSSIELPKAHKIDPYTTWIWLDRNQRMAEDQSVVGRRQIYYDKEHGAEALVYSDTDDEMTEPEEVKRAFSRGEDRILLMAFQEHGTGEEVIKALSQFIGATTLEIQERYITIIERDNEKLESIAYGDSGSNKHISLDKSLSAALDSFDNLFCRRCLIFDCRLHGCSQPLIYPSEKQMHWSEHDEDEKPCSDQCYLRLKAVENLFASSHSNTLHMSDVTKSEGEGAPTPSINTEQLSSHCCTNIIGDENYILGKAEPVTSEPVHSSEVTTGALSLDKDTMIPHSETIGKRKVVEYTDNVACDQTIVPDDHQGSSKKQKRLDVLHSVTGTSSSTPILVHDDATSSEHGTADAGLANINEIEITNIASTGDTSKKLVCFGSSSCDESVDVKNEPKDIIEILEKPSKSAEGQDEKKCGSSSEWKAVEKELYLKGLEIFGRNSCLIARNLLSGFKTCLEVSIFMHDAETSMPNRTGAVMEDNDTDQSEHEMQTKSRLYRRRGKARRLKYSWKSAGHPSVWKRIADGKNQSRKQYIPCGCQSTCGKQCSCLQNGTCCEKYCGCSKNCKNRFRGCHCAKSQCRSRQCPCFAADRECDPDVCRNCWVSCGDNSLGEPPKQGDSQCGNMRLLLRQQQRILLGKSDVAGWGAFLKNPVNKNDYLGEYTGELISHEEADRRGKIYDRADSSFLFDLNDQWVLDAYRKGDKLKFANHSKKPNCHAKVMLVSGDHRVGIFAKEHIDAGEEIFYDYCYPPETEIPWAQAEGTKRDDSSVSQVRAKKHLSH